MGAVDLVIQVESPGSVARGLQRIGRAGHQVGEPSRGKIFPKFRGDLLEAPSSRSACAPASIEETRYPRNPLDVLAQQIVAVCAVDEWDVDELRALVRRSRTSPSSPTTCSRACSTCSRGATRATEFAELRPRIAGIASGRPARAGRAQARRHERGTIPDRGLYGVFLPDGTRVGELDEEMVYESRRGETFVLGASTWRIEDITRDRVVVVAGARRAGQDAVLEGRQAGPAARARPRAGRVHARARDGAARGVARAAADDVGLDELAAANLVEYLDEQREATGAVPDDRTIVVERFRDELGDWRLCVLIAVRRAGARAVGARDRGAPRRAVGPGGAGAVERRRHRDAVARRPRTGYRSTISCSIPTRSRNRSSRVLPGTALFASAFREARRARCCCPAAVPASGRRSGSSGSARPTCWSPPRNTRRSRCCSRPRANACATCSTCRRSARS